jgi:uncharacterized protein (UPF0332 family)
VSEPLETLIQYRLGRAQESLDDARLLAEANRWNACVNRLYYSCFYAVSALLVRDGLSSSRHTGVRSLLNRHYVRTGKVPRDLARVYNDLFERRQEGDYADFVRFQADQVRPWIPQTEAFIAHMKTLLSKDDPQAKQPS